jgi:thiol-disulfide isomerase/thioredoxin
MNLFFAKKCCSTLLFCIFTQLASAQKGYEIRVKLDNYEAKTLVLGYHYADKQYIKDSTTVGSDGFFTFKADTVLPCGVYLLVLKPDNNIIQVLLPDGDQTMTIRADAKELATSVKINGSEDNSVFYAYMDFISGLRPEADTIRAQLSRLKNKPADSLRLTAQLNGMDKRVKKYQTDLMAKHPTFLSTKLIRASTDPEVPEFKGADRDVQLQRYYWYKQHYFDNIDITDGCLLRSPVLFPKMEFYVNKLTPQHPDSINRSLDFLLKKMPVTSDNFKFFLIHFLNNYAKSNFVGQDACYVHLAQEYYCKGAATWAKKEDLEKICDNARRLEPILIGKVGPNITVKTQQNEPKALYDVDADYTVLFFWDPECSHCKKAAPSMVEFAKKYVGTGNYSIKIFSVCTAVTDKASECWKSAQEKEFSDVFFMNLYDPYVQSRYKTLYDVQTTPQIFILNRKHEILMKRVGAEQLGEVMEQILKGQPQK